MRSFVAELFPAVPHQPEKRDKTGNCHPNFDYVCKNVFSFHFGNSFNYFEQHLRCKMPTNFSF